MRCGLISFCFFCCYTAIGRLCGKARARHQNMFAKRTRPDWLSNPTAADNAWDSPASSPSTEYIYVYGWCPTPPPDTPPGTCSTPSDYASSLLQSPNVQSPNVQTPDVQTPKVDSPSEPMLDADFANSIMKEELILQYNATWPEMDEMLHSSMFLFGDVMKSNIVIRKDPEVKHSAFVWAQNWLSWVVDREISHTEIFLWAAFLKANNHFDWPRVNCNSQFSICPTALGKRPMWVAFEEYLKIADEEWTTRYQQNFPRTTITLTFLKSFARFWLTEELHFGH